MSVTVEVTRTGSNPPETVKVVLTQSGGSEEAHQQFDGHEMKFSVSPYPKLGKQISAGEYRLTITVTRSSEGEKS